MIARCLVVMALVLASLPFSARQSQACSCVGYSPPELAAASEVIFSGVARAYVGSTVDATLVEFQVDTIYKGRIASPRLQVQALGGRGPSELGAGCGYGFQLGQQYTVFAIDHDKDGVPNTNGCFRNVYGSISPATYGLAAGQAPARNDEGVPLSIVAAIALALFAVIGIGRRQRRVAP